MKIICAKEDLLRGVQIVQTVVSARSTLPILSNFLLEAQGSTIKLSATDLEVGVSCFIKGEISKEGSITIPAKRFGDIVRELPEDKSIEVRSDESNQIDVKCGKSHFSLMGLPKTDFPVLPQFPEDKNFAVSNPVLKQMLRRTAFAASTDETRYVLNGVYMIVEEGVMRLVSTDGRRLAYNSLSAIDKKISAKAIVPSKAVSEIQRLLAQDESGEDVKIGLAENQIAVKIKDITIISRLIEGNFPNYDQVIPKKHERQIKLKTKETLSAVRQMALLTSDKAAVIKFSFGKNSLRISAQSQGLGSGEVEMDVEHAGSLLEIAFNPGFLMDVLKNSDEDEIYCEVTNPLTPAVLKPVKDQNYLCVIMPMRV